MPAPFFVAAIRCALHYSAIVAPATLDHLYPTPYLIYDNRTTFVEAGMRCRAAAGMKGLFVKVSWPSLCGDYGQHLVANVRACRVVK